MGCVLLHMLLINRASRSLSHTRSRSPNRLFFETADDQFNWPWGTQVILRFCGSGAHATSRATHTNLYCCRLADITQQVCHTPQCACLAKGELVFVLSSPSRDSIAAVFARVRTLDAPEHPWQYSYYSVIVHCSYLSLKRTNICMHNINVTSYIQYR